MTKLDALIKTLNQYTNLAVAVSGGIDSMLLAYVAHRFSRPNVLVMHAHSPAVPQKAFARLQHYAQEHKWSLICIDAKELDDDNYVSNPANRCYFCKSNLYRRIAEKLNSTRDGKMHPSTEFKIASGTNIDDLSDYRPGLQAAKEYGVIQPYVDLSFSKDDIYQLAATLKLSEIESLPAQPCLASRIETGIQVAANDLVFIDEVEMWLAERLSEHETLRCRITQAGVVLEFAVLPNASLLKEIEQELSLRCAEQSFIYAGARNYEKGSAFLVSNAR